MGDYVVTVRDTHAGIGNADRRRGEAVQLIYLLDGEHPDIAGLVEVTEPPGYEGYGIADLRAEAARLGAGGLANIEITPPQSGSGATHFSGLAIHSRDVLRGRPYRELAKLSIDAPAQHQQEAFAELRRRAAAMNADLLVGVHIVRDAQGGPPRLEARAIRLVVAQ